MIGLATVTTKMIFNAVKKNNTGHCYMRGKLTMVYDHANVSCEREPLPGARNCVIFIHDCCNHMTSLVHSKPGSLPILPSEKTAIGDIY